MKRFAILALVATYLLVVVGATVRATGSGLGCPDWPTCFGRIVPPSELADIPAGFFEDHPEFKAEDFDPFKTWVEYINRLSGITVGIIMILLVAAAMRLCRARRDIVVLAWAALILTIVAGIQGAKVVSSELDSKVVSGHMIMALIILATLIRLVVACTTATPGLIEDLRLLKQARLVTVTALILLLLQVFSGATVRGELESLARNQPEILRENRVAELGDTFESHRLVAIVLSLFVFWAAYYGARVRKSGGPGFLAVLGLAGPLLVVAQFTVGLILSYGSFHFAGQIIHIALGSLLMGSLWGQYLILRRA